MYKNITLPKHLFMSLAVMLVCKLIFIAPVFAETTDKNNVEFVVSATDDPMVVKKKWQATINYLQKKLPQYQFNLTVIPIKDIAALKQKVSKDADFIITQPAVYVQLEFELGVSRILTMVKKGGYSVFGSAIIVRKNSNIKAFNDLNDKTIAGVAPHGFGGWLIAKKWLLDHDIDVDADMKQISFLGTHFNVANAVANGEFDVGVIRTGTLEKLAITSPNIYQNLKVFKPQQYEKFSLLASTSLYPEWALAQSHHTNSRVATEIAITLLHLPKNSTIGSQANYEAWTLPKDYNSVHRVLKALRFSPYDKYEKLTLSALFEFYAQELMFIIIIGTLLTLFFIFYLLRNNHKFKMLSRTNYKLAKQLKHYAKELESKVERQKQDLKLIQSNILAQDRLAALGMMLAGITHELRNPMNFILNFSKINEELIEELQQTLQQVDNEQSSSAMEEALDLCADVKENSTLIAQNTLRADKVLQDIFIQMNQENDNSHLDICHVHEIIKQSVFYIKKANRYSFNNVINPECIQINLTASHDQILGSLSNLTRVFINIIDNAIFSMCKRQEIEHNNNPDHAYKPQLIISSENNENNEITILIKDNGVGIEKKIQEKVLKHFFTTKQPGEGTGLGLSISYEIVVTEHNGKLSLRSEPLHYCELKVTLPLL